MIRVGGGATRIDPCMRLVLGARIQKIDSSMQPRRRIEVQFSSCVLAPPLTTSRSATVIPLHTVTET
jgi:hypothetical protein